MSRLEQIGKIREQFIKKSDEVFGAHRLSEEARIILSEHDIEPEETAQKEVIADVLATLDEKEQKISRTSTRHWPGWKSENTAPVRSVEKESR